MTDDPAQKLLALEKLNVAFEKLGQGLIKFNTALNESIKILESVTAKRTPNPNKTIKTH